jgi:hypothetical protein
MAMGTVTAMRRRTVRRRGRACIREYVRRVRLLYVYRRKADTHTCVHSWVLWFRQQRTPGSRIVGYEDGIKRVTAFSSIESLWALTTHLAPPSVLAPTTDYLLFHAAVQRPVWEDR